MKRSSKVGAGALLAPSLFLAQGAFAETLSDFGASASDGRNVVITSKNGQTVKITAYGDGIVRLRAVRAGEAFYADDRYEMVDPRNHSAMGRFAPWWTSLEIDLHGAAGAMSVESDGHESAADYDAAEKVAHLVVPRAPGAQDFLFRPR